MMFADRDDAADSSAEVGSVVRYFRCPATVPVAVLKTLVKKKYGVPDPLRVSTSSVFCLSQIHLLSSFEVIYIC